MTKTHHNIWFYLFTFENKWFRIELQYLEREKVKICKSCKALFSPVMHGNEQHCQYCKSLRYKECLICQKIFIGATKTAKFCSVSCQYVYMKKISKIDISKAIELFKSGQKAVEIARHFNVSRERIRQILQKQIGIAKPPNKTYPCSKCRKYEVQRKNIMCDFCKIRPVYQLVCAVCQKKFVLSYSEYKGRVNRINRPRKLDVFFCDKRCYGRWMGLKYGRYNLKPHVERKYDYEMIWSKHLETGFGASKLSKILSIPESTLSYVLREKRKNDSN